MFGNDYSFMGRTLLEIAKDCKYLREERVAGNTVYARTKTNNNLVVKLDFMASTPGVYDGLQIVMTTPQDGLVNRQALNFAAVWGMQTLRGNTFAPTVTMGTRDFDWAGFRPSAGQLKRLSEAIDTCLMYF